MNYILVTLVAALSGAAGGELPLRHLLHLRKFSNSTSLSDPRPTVTFPLSSGSLNHSLVHKELGDDVNTKLRYRWNEERAARKEAISRRWTKRDKNAVTSPNTKPVYTLPDSKPNYEFSETHPEYKLPDTKLNYKLPDNKPTYELPDTKPTYELPDTKPTYELPDNKPIYELPGDTKPGYELPDIKSTYELSDIKPTYELSDTKSPYEFQETKPGYELTDTKSPYEFQETKPGYELTDTKPSFESPDTKLAYESPNIKPNNELTQSETTSATAVIDQKPFVTQVSLESASYGSTDERNPELPGGSNYQETSSPQIVRTNTSEVDYGNSVFLAETQNQPATPPVQYDLADQSEPLPHSVVKSDAPQASAPETKYFANEIKPVKTAAKAIAKPKLPFVTPFNPYTTLFLPNNGAHIHLPLQVPILNLPVSPLFY